MYRIDEESVGHKLRLMDSQFEPWLQSEPRDGLSALRYLQESGRPGDVRTAEGQYNAGNHRHIKETARLWTDNFVLDGQHE